MASASLNPEELAARLRYTAADLLAIARDHAEVGNVEIAAKMTEAAGELKARADALERDTDLAAAHGLAISAVRRRAGGQAMRRG
jgi:hypothetical protein